MGSMYHELYFHFVWTTYKRNQWIDENNESFLEGLIRDKVIINQSELLAFGSRSDHVHLLIKLHPSVSVSKIVGEIKGYTSYVLANKINPELGFRWQGGYGAFTVSKRDLLGIIKYIKNQKEHHQMGTFRNQWELSGK